MTVTFLALRAGAEEGRAGLYRQLTLVPATPAAEGGGAAESGGDAAGDGGRYYADKPSSGPDWGLRFTMTFVFPK